MSSLVTFALWAIPMVAAGLVVWRLVTFSKTQGSKGFVGATSNGAAILAVFVVSVLALRFMIPWGTNQIQGVIMSNPGFQAGATAAQTGAGLVDGLIGQAGNVLSAPQIQVPQRQAPNIQLPELSSLTAPQVQSSSLSQPFSQWSQDNGLAGSQVTVPPFTAPNIAIQGATPVNGIAPQNLVGQVQVQAQATAKALVAEIQQTVNQAQAQQAPQTNMEALQNFSFNTYLATPVPAADCLTGAQQGPQLPHCIDIDRTGAANQVWAQQQANIETWKKEHETTALQNFSWGDTANAQETEQANIAQASANATVQAQNAYAVAEATRQGNAEYEVWVHAQAEATRQAHEAYLQTLTLTKPTPTAPAPVYQANDPTIPADCLTGNQQGPQLPHCVNVERVGPTNNGSIWTLADSSK